METIWLEATKKGKEQRRKPSTTGSAFQQLEHHASIKLKGKNAEQTSSFCLLCYTQLYSVSNGRPLIELSLPETFGALLRYTVNEKN